MLNVEGWKVRKLKVGRWEGGKFNLEPVTRFANIQPGTFNL
jgi:hypothetical protein